MNYVETLEYGPAGTHGSEGWYVVDRNFYVNDTRWSPPGINIKDIASCYAGPNPSVEALRCQFNDRFYIHGSVREEELPAIFEATTSRTDYRRRNGASLLCATLKGNAAELQQRVILEGLRLGLLIIHLPTCIQIIEIQNRVEDQRVTSSRLSAPEWIH